MPVSGQDGDHAALNRVALGTQTVSVWKDARDLGRAAAEIAVALAGGTAIAIAVVGAKGGDLNDLATKHDMRQTESAPDQPAVARLQRR